MVGYVVVPAVVANWVVDHRLREANHVLRLSALALLVLAVASLG